MLIYAQTSAKSGNKTKAQVDLGARTLAQLSDTDTDTLTPTHTHTLIHMLRYSNTRHCFKTETEICAIFQQDIVCRRLGKRIGKSKTKKSK